MSNPVLRFMGVETEYALAAFTGDGSLVASETALDRMLRRAFRRPHLPARRARGCFFPNASLLYVDGAHLELATAEAASPQEVVLQIKAGERRIDDLAKEVCRQSDVERILVSRTNVHYNPPATWACHESISHRVDDQNALARMLIPMLATRHLLTGSGGFDVNPSAGIRFLTSPRVCFLEVPRSPHSTQQRGIFHDKPDSIGNRNCRRLHLLSECSLSSQWAIWLKAGTVACVTALAEAGFPPPEQVELVDPVAAMRAFAADTTFHATAAVVGGGMRTALEIQYDYLEAVQRRAEHRAMPSWVDEVCARWRKTLDQLQAGHPVVGERLDWAIKRRTFQALADRRGQQWETLPHWEPVFALLAHWGRRSSGRAPGVCGPCEAGWLAACRDTLEGQRRRVRLRRLADAQNVDYESLPGVLELRQQLYELDWRFGELGGSGMFDRLDAAGQLDHRVCTEDEIERAVDQPPATGRARLRGEWVGRLHGESHATCSWSMISTRRGMLDLRDPMTEEATWTSSEQAEFSDDHHESEPMRATRGAGCSSTGGRATRASRRLPIRHATADRIFTEASRDYAIGRYASALQTINAVGRLGRLDRRRRYELSRLRFRVRARAGQIDDLEFRMLNCYCTGSLPNPLREIIDILYVNRFGRLTPEYSLLGDWVRAGRRLAAPGSRLERYEPSLVAEFREALSAYCLATGRIDEANHLCRQLTTASGEALLGRRRWCWALLTEAAVKRVQQDFVGAQRLVRTARSLQRRSNLQADEAEMAAPLAAQLLLDELPPRTSPRWVVDFALGDAVNRLDDAENPLGKMRLLRTYLNLIGPDDPYAVELEGMIARLAAQCPAPRDDPQQLLF